MEKFKLKYGQTKLDITLENVTTVLQPNKIELTGLPQDVVRDALEHPIGTKKLRDIVTEGETVCVIIPDITRGWQTPNIYVPEIIEELSRGGIRDEDITILSATGTHRSHTYDEVLELVGNDVAKRIKIHDHDCKNDDHVSLGTTTYGNEVFINKIAYDADRIVIAGGAIYHFLAGFGGGRKYILPGVASYDTVMRNHKLALNEGLGNGSNEEVRMGNKTEKNPINDDMMQAASMIKIDFCLNIIADPEKGITHAFAGDYIESHNIACKMVEKIDGVLFNEKADIVIGSASGFPKDINLYQTSKTLFNMLEIVEDNGVIIIASECIENYGSKDTEFIIDNFTNMLDREKYLREHFTIGGYIGYKTVETAEKYTFILITEMTQEQFKNCSIKTVKSFEEAIEIAYKVKGKDASICVMPYAANTLPIKS